MTPLLGISSDGGSTSLKRIIYDTNNVDSSLLPIAINSENNTVELFSDIIYASFAGYADYALITSDISIDSNENLKVVYTYSLLESDLPISLLWVTFFIDLSDNSSEISVRANSNEFYIIAYNGGPYTGAIDVPLKLYWYKGSKIASISLDEIEGGGK